MANNGAYRTLGEVYAAGVEGVGEGVIGFLADKLDTLFNKGALVAGISAVAEGTSNLVAAMKPGLPSGTLKDQSVKQQRPENARSRQKELMMENPSAISAPKLGEHSIDEPTKGKIAEIRDEIRTNAVVITMQGVTDLDSNDIHKDAKVPKIAVGKNSKDFALTA